MKIEINKSEFENAENIKALAKAHNKEDFGARAIATNMTYDTFKRALQNELASQPLHLSRSDMSTPNYSLSKAIRGIVNNDLDGLEAEYHQEMVRNNGKLGDGKVYVDTRALTDSSTALISSYSQNVVPSMKSVGLYNELGVRVERVNNGKFVYPLETAFPTSSLLDLNDSNSISASDPSLSSLTLEAVQLGSMTVLARNLLAQESVNLENYVQDALLRSMARKIDEQILIGDGSAPNFNGVINSAGNAEEYANGGSMAFSDLLNAINLIQADGINVSNCAFVFHPDEFKTFINTDRGTDSGNYVINAELQSGSHMVGRCLGIPTFVNDQMSSGSAVLADFSRSVVGFHGGGAIVEVDPYYDFAKGSVAIRLIEDVSFGLLNSNAFCSIKEASS